jgi:hypothetical protein
MPPLLQALLNDLCRPYKKRETRVSKWVIDGIGYDNSIPALSDLLAAVPFETTEISTLAVAVATKLAGDMNVGLAQITKDDLAFLPAPQTWIEWQSDVNDRLGCLITQDEHGACSALVRFFGLRPNKPVRALAVTKVLLKGNPNFSQGAILRHLGVGAPDSYGEWVANFTFHTMGLLAFINTPRVIGRQQHLPHVGLQRKLAASKGLVGKWPLQAWHEIKLEVRPPKEAGDALHETHLTGERAQHFVRAHLRIRLGQLEFVSSHHRGNPALGIKQTKYRLVMPNA